MLRPQVKGSRQMRRLVPHTVTANYTVALSELCMWHRFILDAAREVDVSAMTDSGQWVGIWNDETSPADLTLKNGGTTVATLAAGTAKSYAPGSTGVIGEM